MAGVWRSRGVSSTPHRARGRLAGEQWIPHALCEASARRRHRVFKLLARGAHALGRNTIWPPRPLRTQNAARARRESAQDKKGAPTLLCLPQPEQRRTGAIDRRDCFSRAQHLTKARHRASALFSLSLCASGQLDPALSRGSIRAAYHQRPRPQPLLACARARRDFVPANHVVAHPDTRTPTRARRVVVARLDDAHDAKAR